MNDDTESRLPGRRREAPPSRRTPAGDGFRLGPRRIDAAEALAPVAAGLARVIRLAVNALRRRAGAPDVVVFTLDGELPELAPVRPRWQRLMKPAEDIRTLRERLRVVAGDPRVSGVVVHLRPLQPWRSEVEALREAIADLRKSGKTVTAWASQYSSASYQVACAADRVLLQPGGSIAPLGLRRTYVYLADGLERAGLRFDGVQITPYKTAIDTFARREMSPEAREMAEWLAEDDFAGLVEAVAEGRGVDAESARRLIDEAPFTDEEALSRGLVDAIVAEEDLPAQLAIDGRPARMATWQAARRKLLLPPPRRAGRYVALLRIEGAIVDGKSTQPPLRPIPLPLVGGARAGDLTVVQDVRRVMDDERAAAAVVYIDSPGGSATASEAMAAALCRLAERKPLVAVMGTVAGSGGYYVATPARWIVARPGTITGSIGVVTGKFVGAGLFGRLGMGLAHVQRGRHTDMYASDGPFDDEEREILWRTIQRVYDVFVDRVSASRTMTREAVDAIGGGRVWTGRQAKERGLVDELGGLEAGLRKAREMAGLDPRSPVVEVTTPKTQLAPLASALDPAASLRYPLEGARALVRARALCLCQLLPIDEE